MCVCEAPPLPVFHQAKRQQRKLNFLITQTELYAHFMGGKHKGVGGDSAQDEILRKLDESAAQRQINIGGGVMVNVGHEEYGTVLQPYSVSSGVAWTVYHVPVRWPEQQGRVFILQCKYILAPFINPSMKDFYLFCFN